MNNMMNMKKWAKQSCALINKLISGWGQPAIVTICARMSFVLEKVAGNLVVPECVNLERAS